MEYGLIGEKLGHSYSKVIHEMLGAYDYRLCPLSPEELVPFVTGRQYRGLNVTIPYKKVVTELCDGLDPIAQRIGAVNTLYFKGQKLWGTNTDYDGFLFMAEKAGISLAGRKVLILGSGGASLMVQTAARDEGAWEICVASRSGPVTYDALPKDAEIIVNTTPMGTYPRMDQQPVDLLEFPSCKGVLDLTYNPARTRLLLQAEKLGILCSNGLSMLVAQATAAAEYFTGQPGFRRQSGEIIKRLMAKMTNPVLIGMPGCGKSTLGRALARELHMEFRDTDDIIARKSAMLPGEIIQTYGIDEFRSRESAAAAQIAGEQGRVIATGGGIVLNEENMDALRQNGRIIYIRRPLDTLPRKGRPLSADRDALKKMSEIRTPLYEKYADVIVENTGSFEDTLAQLVKAVRPSPSTLPR